MYLSDMANIFIDKYGTLLPLTNLRLNKLVYFTQVEALRTDGSPIFSDDIETWEDGPIVLLVYQTFRDHGREMINQPSGILITDMHAQELVHAIATTYDHLSAFDLITVTRRDRGACKNAYMPGSTNKISVLDRFPTARNLFYRDRYNSPKYRSRYGLTGDSYAYNINRRNGGGQNEFQPHCSYCE